MKKTFFIIAITGLFLSCQQQETIQSTTIMISDSKDSLTVAELYRPVNGIILWDNRVDSLTINNSHILEIDEPEYVRLKVGDKRVRMILLPGQNYIVDYANSDVSFANSNSKGQMLFSSFDRTPPAAFNFLNQYNNDSTALMVSKAIEKRKRIELDQLDNLLQSNEIDANFHDMIKTDIDYYYADGLATLALFKGEEAHSDLENEFQNLFNDVITRYPIDLKNKTYNWSEYVMTTQINKSLREKYTNDQLSQLYKKDSLHYKYVDIIKQELEDPYRQLVLVNYILSASKQKQHESSLVSLYEDLNNSYPDNPFSSYIKEDIDPIIAYHHKITEKLPQTVLMVEGEEINSLTTLLKSFTGQKLYIDIWATWCGPCKREFANNHLIEDLLIEKGYKKLYISIDKQEVKDKWIELIKFYNLAGYHHLASQEFFIDFEKNYSTGDGMVYIPQYLVIDENGNIITNNAPRPGLPDELAKIL